MDVERLKIDRGKAKQRGTGRRRGGSRWGLAALALGMGVGLAVFWRPLNRTIDRLRLPEVRVTRVQREHPAAVGAVEGMAANGYVVAARRAALSADTPGRIVEMRVEEGSVVQEGEVVARLYAEEYAAALQRARAEVAVAEAALERARAGLSTALAEVASAHAGAAAAQSALESARSLRTLTDEELKRIKALVEREVFTTRELDQARSDFERADAEQRRATSLALVADEALATATARVEVAEAEVEVAQAQLEAARAARVQAAATLAKTEVRAPFSGVVVLKDAEVGEVVSPNVTGGTSTRGAVVTMVDFSSLEVQAEVPETSLGAVTLDAPVQVFLDAYPDRPYPGVVSRIWPTADRQKATVEVRATFLQPDDRLRPEMGLRVVFLPKDTPAEVAGAPEGPPPLLLVEEAVVRADGGFAAFVYERGVVALRPLDLGPRRGGRVVVRAGVQEGEQVVLDPPPGLADGDRVQLEEKP